MSKTQHIDLVLIDSYLETLNLTMLHQMLDLYNQQSQCYLQEIHTAIVKEDQIFWQEQCHKMKGSAASVGLTLVHENLKSIEKSSQDWSIKSEYLSNLTLLNQQAIASFKEWLINKE